MSALFAALALSMFGLYELHLPQAWAARLAATAGNKGSAGGAALLGFGSALIVGPCVTPPLAAALVGSVVAWFWPGTRSSEPEAAG